MDLAPFVQGGAVAALIGVIFYLARQISSGEWVPKRELDYVRADRDSRLAEKEREVAGWRSAHETSERTRELLTGQNRDLIDSLRAQERFFDAFRAVIERDPGDES